MSKPPDDRMMEQLVRGWLRDETDQPADRNRQIGRIMGRIDETRQRRGVWRLFPFWRGVSAVDDADDELAVARRGAVAPVAVAMVAVFALVITSLAYGLLRAPEPLPGTAAQPSASPLEIDPADAALFERMRGDLWKGVDSDLDLALELYAEDAVHTALWWDRSERFEGSEAISLRMLESNRVDPVEQDRVRLPDGYPGVHRYFGYASGTGCVFWIRDEQITRHDCILPMSLGTASPAEPTWDPVGTSLAEVDPAAAAARRALTAVLYEASAAGDVLTLGDVIAPDVLHHVQSESQEYTVEGFDDWVGVMTGSPITTYADIDLPAPEGELRWANFSSVGGGSLCLFYAREGKVFRQDCVVPVFTSMLFEADPAAGEGDAARQPTTVPGTLPGTRVLAVGGVVLGDV
ncbi:MAG: hypothetical protein PVG27_00455 [Chloroflexota bacterium]